MVMKKYCLLLAAFAALVSCSKEAEICEEETTQDGLVEYSFNACIAPVTKAYADENASGAMTWNSGDEIALYNSTTGDYVNFSAQADGTNVTFKGTAPAGAVFTKAYYPADYRGESVASYYATKYSGVSLANSQKYFAMEDAEISLGDESLYFVQKGSLVKFSVSNVPSFTRKAKLVFGSLTETVAITSAEAATGSIEAYFAIPAGTANLTFSLEDSAGTPNTFYSKTRESAKMGYEVVDEKDVETPKLYRYTVDLGPVITFSGTGVSTINKMKLTQCIGDGYGSNNVIWSLLTNGSTKYVVLPYAKSGYYDWIDPGIDAVQVDVYNGDTWKAQCRYIYVRDTDFTITTDDTTLSTEYRVYPYGTTKATSLYATYATGTYDTPDNVTFNVTDNGNWWSSKKCWYAAHGSTVIGSAWPGTAFGSSFTLPADDIYNKSTTIVLNNGNTSSMEQTHDLTIDGDSYNHVSSINIAIASSWDNGKRPISITGSTDALEILAEPLGDGAGYEITIPKTFDATKYVPIPVSYVGKTLNFVFKGGDSDVNWNSITINRDFYYSF